MNAKILRLALTPGEPAGIGPDIVLQIAQQSLPVELVVIADQALLQQRAQQLGLPITLISADLSQPPQPHRAGVLKIIHVPLKTPSLPGHLDKANAAYVIKTLEIAAQSALAKQFQAIVTGPVHKGIINAAGIKFSGHTEFFAELTHTPLVVMMLAAKKMRVALMTTHLPLAAVAQAITANGLEQTLRILQHDLQHRFALSQPKILVAGLNPHAGEEGYLGREEINIITPTLNKLRAEGIQLIGPLAADTLFTPKYLAQADAILAMYHDQGLPVLKYYGFGEAVNVTLGLPIIRTSVDHGTALDLAGTGTADSGSLMAAINMAMEMCKNSQH